MEIIKFSSAKGSTTSSSRKSGTSSVVSAGSSTPTDLTAVNAAIKKTQEDIASLKSALNALNTNYLKKGGDTSLFTYTFGDVVSTALHVGKVTSPNGESLIVKEISDSIVPIINASKTFDSDDYVDTGIDGKNYFYSIDNMFNACNDIEGVYVRFKAGYTLTGITNANVSVESIQCFYTEIPIIGIEAPTGTNVVASSHSAGSHHDYTGDYMSGDGSVDYGWTMCSCDNTEGIFTIPLESDGAWYTYRVMVKVFLNITFASETQQQYMVTLTSAGTLTDTTTYCNGGGMAVTQITPYMVDVQNSRGEGMKILADGIYQMTDGTNWVKILPTE